MPKLKAGTILPTPAEGAAIIAAAKSDLDAVPFTDAQWVQVKPPLCRGRPLGSGAKMQIALRPDTDVQEKFKASGDSWQTRTNDVLSDHA